MVYFGLSYLTDLTAMLHDLAFTLIQFWHNGYFLSGYSVHLVMCGA